ncbi:hypothetical protein, partial [uncultured Nocardioides sp.]|uniref:hypothetical protein n=1 Tax=uncultured Nocardioides sp. TaxID=198441 RepID=UPI002628B427
MSDLLSARFVQDVTVWDVGDYLEGLERCTKWPYVATVIDLGSVQAPVPASGNLIRFTDPYRQQAPLGGDVIHWRSSRLVPSIARAIDVPREQNVAFQCRFDGVIVNTQEARVTFVENRAFQVQ